MVSEFTEFKVICISNKPTIFLDNSSNYSDRYLTVGRTYICSRELVGSVFIQFSDLGGPPHGHMWWSSNMFRRLDDVREEKINDLLS